MMIVLIDHSLFKLWKVNLSIEEGKFRLEVFNLVFSQVGRVIVLFVGKVEIGLFLTHGLIMNFRVSKIRKIYKVKTSSSYQAWPQRCIFLWGLLY